MLESAWHQHSLDLEPEHNRVGRAKSLGSPGNVAYQRFLEARAADQHETVLLGHLNDALHGYQQALDLLPADDAEDLATAHGQIGNIYDFERTGPGAPQAAAKAQDLITELEQAPGKP